MGLLSWIVMGLWPERWPGSFCPAGTLSAAS